MASVSLRNAKKVYDNGVVAVKDFNLEVTNKEFITLVGPSGCGKSTILRMIAGVEDVTEGEIYIGDRLVNELAPKDREIAMVFKNYALYPHMSVYDNMAFALKLANIPIDEINRLVLEAADILDIDRLLDRKPNTLSDSQKQRVAMGRAIVRNPKVFLMDDPIISLDDPLRIQMRSDILDLHKRLNKTFIYVTNDQEEAMCLGDRVVVINDGTIKQADTPQNIYDKPANLFVAGYIGTPLMNFIDARVKVVNDEVLLEVSGYRIPLPENKAKKVAPYDGEIVTLGIRGEDIHDEESYIETSKESIIDVTVASYKLVGEKVNLYLEVDKHLEIVARVNPKTAAKREDKIQVALDTSKIHVFDRETEQIITN